MLRVGVIGLGVGAQHVASYAAMDDVEVSAICDLDRTKLADVGDRWEIGLRYDDYRRITEDPDIDAVSICSYDDVHVAQAVSAFENGKHAFVEKPVALNRQDAERLLTVQQDSGKLISSNLILRQSPRFIELRRMVRDGALGDVFYIEGDYLHSIGWKITEGWRGKMDFYSVTYGGGIHLIDLMRWILGREVQSVCGMGTDIATRDSTYRYPDTIANLLTFDGGVLAKTLTTLVPQRPKFHALNVYGTQATFVNGLPQAVLYTGDDPDEAQPIDTPYPGARKGDLLPDFVAAIRGGGEPNVSAVDVFRVMDVCFACWESVQQQRTVKVSYQL